MSFISRLKTSSELAKKLVFKRLRSPTDFLQILSKIYNSLCRGGLSQLQRDIATSSNVHYIQNSYPEWIASFDKVSPTQELNYLRLIEKFKSRPTISIVLPVYNPPPQLLIEAIESVKNQLYPYWQLCVSNDASTDPKIADILDAYSEQDERIEVVHRKKNGHISEASNSALQLVSGDWVALLDHDDLLTNDALFYIANEINSAPDVAIIYSDEDKIDLSGKRHDPHFKTDFNYDLFLSYNMISHLGVYKKSLLDKTEGFRIGYEGAQDYDLTLRCLEHIEHHQIRHIPHILYHWRVTPESTAHDSDAKPYAIAAGEKALNDYILRSSLNANVTTEKFNYKIWYNLPEQTPLVSLIIPTRNAVELLKAAINSIRERTIYPNYEILVVDNGSDEPAALAYLNRLNTITNIKVIRDNRPFNYSALNNNAVSLCKGEIIGLLNNDISVISPDWLNEMVSLAIQKKVGAVGAMLYYPNDTIQHGGIVLGIGDVAGYLHHGINRGSLGYFCRATSRQSVSAVTAACLIVTRENYLRIKGLDEQNLAIAYNDVDFCLKLNSLGLRNIWTPYAELYHHESATRGKDTNSQARCRLQKESQFMHSKWGERLKMDPNYSPNFTYSHTGYELAFQPRKKQ